MTTDVTKDIVSGDDVAIPVTLKKKNAVFTIATGATISASLLTYDKQSIIIDPVNVLEANAGSDWINSLIVVEFSSSDTANILKDDKYKIEVQIIENTKRSTWFISVEAELGSIP